MHLLLDVYKRQFLGSGVLLFITGDTVYKFWHQIMGQQNIPFPSFIDVIYITMYPVVAVGLLLLARARVPGGNRASLIDSLTITLAVGLLSWIFLIGPNVRAPGGMLVRLTSAAYPLGDVLVLAMLAHLWSAGGFRNTAGRLLAVGALGTLVSDSLYGLANLHPAWNWSDGNPVDLGWILFYACWGAAALHPSMRELSEPRKATVQRTTWARLALLAVASLIAPTVLIIETILGNPVDAPMIAVVAADVYKRQAIGGGFCLSLAADIRVAAQSAYFRAAGINNGLTAAELGLSYLLPRAVGSSRAAEIMLTGRDVDATEAERCLLYTSRCV